MRCNGTLPFKKIGHIIYYDIEDIQRMLDAHETTDAGARIAADEENCFDRTKTRFFVVEEAETPAS